MLEKAVTDAPSAPTHFKAPSCSARGRYVDIGFSVLCTGGNADMADFPDEQPPSRHSRDICDCSHNAVGLDFAPRARQGERCYEKLTLEGQDVAARCGWYRQCSVRCRLRPGADTKRYCKVSDVRENHWRSWRIQQDVDERKHVWAEGK